MAEGMLSGMAGRTPAPFRGFMVERLEPLRPRLEAARAQATLSEAETARIAEFSHTPLGRKLGRAYLAWADSLRGEWTAQLRPRTQQVKDNFQRSVDDLRAILREYEQWRSGQLRDAWLLEVRCPGASSERAEAAEPAVGGVRPAISSRCRPAPARALRRPPGCCRDSRCRHCLTYLRAASGSGQAANLSCWA